MSYPYPFTKLIRAKPFGTAMFLLIDHPPAKRAYAWSKDEFGAMRHVVILGIPPAVRAAIIEEAQQKIPRGKAAFETGVG